MCARPVPSLVSRAIAGRVALAAAFAVALPPTPAQAQIYKCSGTGSVPIYQDRPCMPGLELRNFESDPAQVSVLPMPPLPATGHGNGSGSRNTARATRHAPASPSAARAQGGRGGDPAQRRYLSAGMQAGEVLARAGTPDMKAGGGKSARWTYLPHPGDAQTLTTVVIEDGRVVDVERKVVR